MADRRSSPANLGISCASPTNQQPVTAPPPPPATGDTPPTPPASNNSADTTSLEASNSPSTMQATTSAATPATTTPLVTGDTGSSSPASNDDVDVPTANDVGTTPSATTSATTAEEPAPFTPPTPPTTTSATTAEEPAPSSHTMARLYDVRYQNAWRVDWALEDVLPVLAAFAHAAIKDAHANLLATKSSSEPGAATLADLSPCSEHHRNPGDAHFKTSVLHNCASCRPWIDALAAAHATGKHKNLNANHMYPNLWRDPIAGPWSIATIFTRAGSAATITDADATCLINIMLYYKLAFPSLTPDDHRRLKAIQTVRNNVAHLNQRKLSQEETMDYIGTCVELLTEGPWTDGPFAAKAAAALERVLAWRDRPIEMLPQLDQLKNHYVPQPTPLAWLRQAFTSHRIFALCGLGGIGKSTAALAHAWHLARTGACPGRHGVLWASAANDAGGMTGALATIVQSHLGMFLSAAEASDATVVRQRLQGWASQRSQPWLLVLDNVEPGTKESAIMTLLGEHGSALVTTRAGPNALHRDMDLPRAAVLRMECLAPEDSYDILMTRYTTGSQAAAMPLASTEETAARALVGTDGVAGLPVAVVQVAALVAATPHMTFVSYLEQFQALSQGGVTTQLPGDDGGQADVAADLARLLTACGLQDVVGLLDKLVAECESLDDVQWLEEGDVAWGSAAGAQPSAVQRRKWAAFKRQCKEAGAAARHEATVATVWATQLKVLPKYCVELLRCASCCAPEHIPQALFEEAVQRWVEAAGAGADDLGWLASFAAKSALVAKVAGASGGCSDVVEAAVKWLDDLSLLQRGAWVSAGDIHAQLAAGALRESNTNTEAPATGGAGQGAGAGPHNSSSAPSNSEKPRPWISMHRLVQGVVFGQATTACVACGAMALAGMKTQLVAGVDGVASVLRNGSSGDANVTQMELAAWLAAHGHGVQLGRAVSTHLEVNLEDAGCVQSATDFVKAVEALSRLVKVLGLFTEGDGWYQALEASTALMRRLHGAIDSSDVARALNNLASLYQAGSRYAEAEPLFVQALAMEQRLHGDSDSSEVAKALNNLGLLHQAQSRYDEAETLHVQALAMEQRLHGGSSDSSALARCLNNLALMYKAQSRYDEAEPLFAQALAMQQRLHDGKGSSAVVLHLNNLADLYKAQSRYDEAEPLLVQALAMEQRLRGDADNSAVARSLHNLAGLFFARSCYDEAEPLLVQALAMEQRLHGDSDSSAVATSLNSLAQLYQAQSRYDEAEPLFVQALAMEQRLHGGSDSSAVAAALNNLGLLYKAQSRYDEAKPLYVQALAMEQRLHGDSDNSAVARSLHNLATLYEIEGRYAEAEPLYVQALAMEQRLHGGSDSSAVASYLNSLALLYQAQSRYDEAEPLYVQALAMDQRLHGDSDSSAVAQSLHNLAALYEAQSRYDEAEPLLVTALAMEQRLHGGSDSSAVAGSLNMLALLYESESRYDEAEPLLVQALAMEQRLARGSDSSDVVRSLNNLAGLYYAQSRYDEAKPLLVQALAMVQRVHGHSDSSHVARSLNSLALLYEAQSRYDKAEPLYEQAVGMLHRLHERGLAAAESITEGWAGLDRVREALQHQQSCTTEASTESELPAQDSGTPAVVQPAGQEGPDGCSDLALTAQLQAHGEQETADGDSDRLAAALALSLEQQQQHDEQEEAEDSCDEDLALAIELSLSMCNDQ